MSQIGDFLSSLSKGRKNLSYKRINNKSVQEEYKIWVLVTEAYGYVQLGTNSFKKKGRWSH